MNYYKKRALFIMCVIVNFVNTNSEQWYSAFERQRHNLSQENKFTPEYIQFNENHYEPLVLLRDKNNDQPDDRMLTNKTDGNTNSTKSFITPSVTIHYKNTVNNVNILRRVGPKWKHIRKKCPSSSQKQKKPLNDTQRVKSRFLEVFQVVEFDHASCTSSSGLEGVCLHEYDCTASGGLIMGTCADGYGNCCINQFQCDTRSTATTGWFTNPGFPSPSSDRLSCALTLNKASEDINQIRLDFNIFELLPPTSGECQQDQFVVSGQNVNSLVPILCGINTGQHVYIEVGDVNGPITLSVQTESPERRLFAIKVTQLTWADDIAAPSGCLQYYNEPQGYLESFNYRESDFAFARRMSYLNNLNYAMCIERAPETCSVTYTNVGNMQIVNYDTGLPIIPPGQAGVEILNCPSDWLLIAATRLCGERLNDGSVFQDFSLNAPITDSNAGPIVIWFRSDEAYVGYGFKLQYQQNNCNPSIHIIKQSRSRCLSVPMYA